MKKYGGIGGIAPPFLTWALDGSELSASRPRPLPPPRKELPVPTEWEARKYPEPVWTLWNREKSLAPAGDRTPTAYPVISPVAAIPAPVFKSVLLIVYFISRFMNY
jgi:hypothetical protein